MQTSEIILLTIAAGALGLGAGAIFGGGKLVRTFDWDTEWHIDAPVDLVYHMLTTPEEQYRWWPSMQVARTVRHPQIPGADTITYRVHQAQSVARLVPPFKITASTLDIEPERRLRSVVTGNLVGVLETLLFPISTDKTRIQFHWYVRVSNPLLNLAGFFLTPMFRASHDHVMREGEAGLQRYCAELIQAQVAHSN